MDALDNLLKWAFYGFCNNIAKWIYAIKIASDVIKRSNEGDFMSVLKAVGTGCISYGCLYCIVYFLEMVQQTIQSSFN